MILITDPLFYALAIPAVLLTAIGKGGFAGSAGGVAVPAMAVVLPVPQAAAISLILLCAMDLSGLKAWWGQWDKREMRVIVPGGIVGVGLGALLLGSLSPRMVAGLLGIITLGFVAYRLWSTRRGLPPPAPHSVVKGAICSAASGITSTLAHAGAPPLQIYMLPRRLPRATFAATNVVFFGVINYVKLVPYGMLGLFDWTNLLTSLVLLPLCPIGVHLGIWMQKRISEALFYRIVVWALLASGFKLVWDGFIA